MVQKVHLNPEERGVVQLVRRAGLHGQPDQWTVARLALARSLQEPERPRPDEFAANPQQRSGIELHAQQLTGEGKPPPDDFTDVYRALLTAYEGRDLFANDDAFHEALQRHIRRGLKLLESEWTEGQDFNRYLLDQLFHERASDPGPNAAETEAFGERVERILAQIGVAADVHEVREGPRLTRFTLELQALDDLDRFRRGFDKIAFALGFGEDALTSVLAPGERQIYLSVPRPRASWRAVDWRDVASVLSSPSARAMALPVCVGVDVLGEPFAFDLAETPHLFIGGTTGSGKSMCLHALLLSLLRADPLPELLLIDPKAVEFTAYEGLPHLRGGGVVTQPDDALAALDDLVAAMNSRQQTLNQLDARNIAEANARGAKLSRIVAVVDELGDLFMTNRAIETPLIRLAQKARSAGIHLVLATQRPEAATFPGLLRSNIPSRIALTVQKSAESRIILDEGGAENLLMRGDMLIRLAGRSTVRAHGCRIEQADILAAVRDV